MDIPEGIDDPRLFELYGYWRSRRGDRFAPARGDVDPADIPRLLPHLLLIEIFGRRYRYRLVGTEVEQHFGCAMQGRHVDELMRGEYLGYISSLFERLIAERAPVYTESAYSPANGRQPGGDDFLRTKRQMLPLSSAGESVDMVLAGQVFFAKRGTADRTVLLTQDRFDDVTRSPAERR
jgi:hypothetical protein